MSWGRVEKGKIRRSGALLPSLSNPCKWSGRQLWKDGERMGCGGDLEKAEG
jgi:hypothetical protein